MEKIVITNTITGIKFNYEASNVLAIIAEKAIGNESLWGYPNNYSYEIIDITEEYNKRIAKRNLSLKAQFCKEIIEEIKFQFDAFSFEDKTTLKSRADINLIINTLAIDGSLVDLYQYALSIPTDALLTQALKDSILTFWNNKITEYNNLVG